jgi:diacylglycerol kinase
VEELYKLLQSFRYALRGIAYAVRTQRNMRIHLVAVAVVVWCNTLAGLSTTHWCLELLCCMAVLSLELVNTAVERVCDRVTQMQNTLIGQAKDAAAGAVLVSAVGAVCVALLVFFRGDPGYRERLVAAFQSWRIYALLPGAMGAGAFVFLPSILQKHKNQ